MVVADQPAGRVQEGPGGTGEGEGQDLLRAGALGGDEVGDAPGDRPRLPGAGPGQDQQGPSPVGDGGTLSGVETGED